MLRAIYEGVAFCHKYHIEKLYGYVDSIDVVRMAGGAARSAVWMQMFSDILGLPVEVSKAEELGAMGVALEAAVGTGLFGSITEAAEQWVKIKAVYYPDIEKSEYYNKKYEIYKKIVECLSNVWKDVDRLNDI